MVALGGCCIITHWYPCGRLLPEFAFMTNIGERKQGISRNIKRILLAAIGYPDCTAALKGR